MTMCTFAQVEERGNARGVNCGWTGGEPDLVGRDGRGGG